MNPILTSTAMILSLVAASCSTPEDLEPIPGSITYGGQPHGKLTRSPIGSVLPHEFYNQFGNWVQETYIVQPDRTLKLVRREIGQYPER